MKTSAERENASRVLQLDLNHEEPLFVSCGSKKADGNNRATLHCMLLLFIYLRYPSIGTRLETENYAPLKFLQLDESSAFRSAPTLAKSCKKRNQKSVQVCLKWNDRLDSQRCTMRHETWSQISLKFSILLTPDYRSESMHGSRSFDRFFGWVKYLRQFRKESNFQLKEKEFEKEKHEKRKKWNHNYRVW